MRGLKLKKTIKSFKINIFQCFKKQKIAQTIYFCLYFKYLDLNDTCPYLGPQAKVDKFGGLCITWSLMYFLLRVLNPFLDQSQINKQMISGNHKQILNKVLQFQRYVIDYLRNA